MKYFHVSPTMKIFNEEHLEKCPCRCGGALVITTTVKEDNGLTTHTLECEKCFSVYSAKQIVDK